MPPRTTFSDLSPPPVTGTAFLAEYAQRLKSLFDASALPLTSVAGTGNAVTASLDPPLDPGGLVNGMKFTITWAAANTGAVTLAINGGTAVPVVDADNVALAASALASGRRSLIEFISGSFRILSGAGAGAGGAGPTYEVFTASGTWNRPSGYDPDTVVLVQAWGGGGAGARTSLTNLARGGGGGGYIERQFRMSELPASVAVTIGAGGATAAVNAVAGAGGNTTFGSLLTAYGGGGGFGSAAGTDNAGGGGGGELSAGQSGAAGANGLGGRIGGGDGSGGGAANTFPCDAKSIFGGGGGRGGANVGPAGAAVFGGGGGGGGTTPAGVSLFAGNGGAEGQAGFAPGGGGGGGSSSGPAGAGARGELRVWIFG